MKKMLFLFFIILSCSGCWDYQELNDQAIIVGAAIDYKESQFVIHFEALNGQKSSASENASTKGYLVEGSGKTLSEAYQDAFFHLNKDAYYAHLKVIVFSEEVAKNHIEECIDYILRDPNTRNVFYPVVAKDVSAQKILESQDDQVPIVSQAIESLIENNSYKETVMVPINFEHFVSKLLDFHQDASLNAIELMDGKIAVGGSAIFHDYTMVKLLDLEETKMANVLNNTSTSYNLKLECTQKPNHYITLNLYDNKNTKMKVTEEGITIEGNYNANIQEDECHYNFKDTKTYDDMEQQFATLMNQKIVSTMKRFQGYGSDFLGIEQTYYRNTKQDLPTWQSLPIQSDATFHINKNGIIFEVKK